MVSKKSTTSTKSPINEVKTTLQNTTSLISNINAITFIIISIIITALVIVLHYSMHTWTKELEKQGCECSDMWHRNIVHWLALIFLILIPINIMIRYFKINNIFTNMYSIIIGVTFITYICIIIDYIRKLKELECQCSESWKREYGYIFSIIYISLLAIVLFSIIMGGLMISSKFS